MEDKKLTIFKKNKWYDIRIITDKLYVDGKIIEQPKNIVEYHVRFDKDTPIDYNSLLLKTIRYPLSFWKMLKLWKQNRRSNLCR